MPSDTLTVEPGSPGPSGTARAPADRRNRGMRRSDVLVGAGVVALVGAVYLPYALRAGWYYDDWSIYAQMRDATSQSLLGHYHACAATQPAGRSLACVYHATEFSLFEAHRVAYHLCTMAFLALIAILGYAVLRRCRLPWPWAGLAAALLVVFPGSDSTRLWAVGSIAQYVLALQLLGLLLALAALRRPVRWQAIALHVLAAALSVLAMATYEIAVPLVALNGLVYLAAYRRRGVLWRCGVDVALAVGFVVYRLVIDPVSGDAGFVVGRTLGQDLARAGTLLGGAWTTWSATFVPSTTLAVLGIVVVLGVAAAAAAADRPLLRRLVPWAALLGGSVVMAGITILVYITANDLYVPAVGGTFNRLNLPASLPYCVAFVALLGMLFELLRRFAGGIVPAGLVVAAVALAVGWHQLGISSDHKRAWEESWRVQSAALAEYPTALRGVPSGAAIVGFDTPIWESSYVPVFSATWDLRGALDFTTRKDPATAVPLEPTVSCGPRAVVLAGQAIMPYAGGPPLYFVSPRRARAVAIHSQRACRRRIRRWGRPPFFGRTVTQPGAVQ